MNKRLTKGDPFDSMIGGVCSGLSEYLNIDVTLIRIVWLFSVLCYGVGLLPYIVLAFIMPNKY